MTAEENMRWKHEEEETKELEKQNENQIEKSNALEEILLAEGPYEDQVIFWEDEEQKEKVFSKIEEEEYSFLDEKNKKLNDEEKSPTETTEEETTGHETNKQEKDEKRKNKTNESYKEWRGEQTENYCEKMKEKVKEQERINEKERRKTLDELDTALLKKGSFEDQVIFCEDAQKELNLETQFLSSLYERQIKGRRKELSKHHLKEIEKIWNKYATSNEVIPEEISRNLIRLHGLGIMKGAGLIKKENNWVLETSWKNHKRVIDYLEKLGKAKSFGYQLWAEVKTGKSLYVSHKRKREKEVPLYYTTTFMEIPKLPENMKGFHFYIRNTDNFFNKGYNWFQFYQKTIKEFEKHFFTRLHNWGIDSEKYAEIRTNIFNLFQNKYSREFQAIKDRKKRPIVFILKYSPDSLENSFIRSFYEYYGDGGNSWKFRTGGGKKSYDSYYSNFNYKLLASYTKHYRKGGPNSIDLRSPITSVVNQCLDNKNPEKLRLLTEIWNNFVLSGKRVSETMWKQYNEVQSTLGYPLRRFRSSNTNDFLLRYYNGIANDLNDLIKRRGRFPTSLYEQWLVFRGEKEGSSPFIEIEIKDPIIGRKQHYFIPNVDYKWNNKVPAFIKSTFQESNKDRTGIRMMIDLFMKTIPVTTEDSRNIRILIVKELQKKGFFGNEKPGNWFKSYFKLKYDLVAIDDVLEQYFWKIYDQRRNFWTDHTYISKTPNLQYLIRYYEEKKRQYTDFSKELVDLSEIPPFKIKIVDKSLILKEIIRELIDQIKDKGHENLRTAIKNDLSAYTIAQAIQKHKVLNSISIDEFSVKKARINYHPDITSDHKKFWNESLNNGITRFSAALVQDSGLRSRITEISKKEMNIGRIKFPEKLIVEEHWGRITNKRNVNTHPDNIGFLTDDQITKGEAIIFSQNKIARLITHRGSKNTIGPIDYLLDFYKTIGTVNDDTGIMKLQLEFIGRGETLGGLVNGEENCCIISYWSTIPKELCRIGGITNAIVKGLFDRKIKEKQQLIDYTLTTLKEGKTALNGRKLAEVDETFINKLVSSLEPLSDLKLTEFYKKWFVEIVERFNGDF